MIIAKYRLPDNGYYSDPNPNPNHNPSPNSAPIKRTNFNSKTPPKKQKLFDVGADFVPLEDY